MYKKRLIVSMEKEQRKIEELLRDLEDNVGRHRNNASKLTYANDIKTLIADIAELGQKQANILQENLQLLRDFISVEEDVMELWKEKTELYEVFERNAKAALGAVQKDGIAYQSIQFNVKLAEYLKDEGKRQYKMREDIAQTCVTIMVASVELAGFNTLHAVGSDYMQYASQKGKAVLEFAKNAVSLCPGIGEIMGVLEVLRSLILVVETNMEQNRDLFEKDESLANYQKRYSEQLEKVKFSGQYYESLKKAIESLIAGVKQEQNELRKGIAEMKAVLCLRTAF